jgi:hypothetical protein
MLYLYVKIHSITGLKYLGKTKQKDPHKYKGSGKLWLRHIRKHGYIVTTKILFQTECVEELSKQGLYYSKLWNVTKSSEWANLCDENGKSGYKLGPFTEQHKQNMRKPKPNKTNYKISAEINNSGNRLRKYKLCTYCNKNIDIGNYAQQHGDACNHNPNKIKDYKNPFLDKKHTIEAKNKMSISQKNAKKYKCKYCSIQTTKGNIIRWHNDKCKHNPGVES